MTRQQTIIAAVAAVALIALGVVAWLVLRTPHAELSANATAAGVTQYDRTMGDPKAPIVLIEYAAPMCPICAAFNEREFPLLKAQYIDTGKVFYVYRVYPIGAPDVAAEGLARCLPAEQYLPFIDTLYKNQDKWDPDGHDIPDVRAALIAMAARVGMSKDKAASCIDDKATQNRTMTIAKAAADRFAINGTPSFIMDGQLIYTGEYPWDLMQPMLDEKLAHPAH